MAQENKMNEEETLIKEDDRELTYQSWMPETKKTSPAEEKKKEEDLPQEEFQQDPQLTTANDDPLQSAAAEVAA